MGYKNLKFPSDTLFLVTGAAGFVGSNLCEAILNMGYKVRALDDLSTGKQKMLICSLIILITSLSKAILKTLTPV